MGLSGCTILKLCLHYMIRPSAIRDYVRRNGLDPVPSPLPRVSQPELVTLWRHTGRAPLIPLRKGVAKTSMALLGCLSMAYMSAAQLPSGSSNSPTNTSPGPCHGPHYATTERWRLLVHNYLNDSSRSAAVLPQCPSAPAIHPLIPAMYLNSYNRAPESCKGLHHSSQHISTFPATHCNLPCDTLQHSPQHTAPFPAARHLIAYNALYQFLQRTSPISCTALYGSFNNDDDDDG